VSARIPLSSEGTYGDKTSELLDRFVDLFNANRLDEAEQDFAANGYAEKIGTSRIVWSGTNTGSLMGQPATGRAVTVRATVLLKPTATRSLALRITSTSRA
jgi:hypothetical protein